MNIPTEYDEQCALVEYLELKGLMFSKIAQETFTRSWGQKMKNQRSGLRKGLPDMFIYIRHLKALFNYGIDILELTIKNPCHKLKFYPVDINLKKIPTEEEIAEIREQLNKEQKLLFDFVDETACRVNEAVRLEAKDVAKDTVVLYTRKSKNSNLTPRIIPRPECLKGEFKGKVFKEWTTYPHFLKEIADGWSFHNLRHRRASLWASAGMPIFEIMQRLGHMNLATTQKYLQLIGVANARFL